MRPIPSDVRHLLAVVPETDAVYLSDEERAAYPDGTTTEQRLGGHIARLTGDPQPGATQAVRVRAAYWRVSLHPMGAGGACVNAVIVEGECRRHGFAEALADNQQSIRLRQATPEEVDAWEGGVE
jgi:hypothetical protein